MPFNFVKRAGTSLLQRLQSRGMRPPEDTRDLIKIHLAEEVDMDIATSSLKVSLICPLGKMRMNLPCRAITCAHFQCFDAACFLQMYERKPTWICPVCDSPILYEDLAIDGYFSDILMSKKLPPDCVEIYLNALDGEWTTEAANLRKQFHRSRDSDESNMSIDILDVIEASPLINRLDPKVEIVDKDELDLSSDVPSTKNGAPVLVDLTESSSDSDGFSFSDQAARRNSDSSFSSSPSLNAESTGSSAITDTLFAGSPSSSEISSNASSSSTPTWELPDPSSGEIIDYIELDDSCF